MRPAGLPTSMTPRSLNLTKFVVGIIVSSRCCCFGQKRLPAAARTYICIQPPAMTTRNYSLLLAALISFSLGGGYMAATQPPGAGWRFFSWHPLLMTIGMVGMAGIGAVTKKLGGYTNTKVNHHCARFCETLCASTVHTNRFSLLETSCLPHSSCMECSVGIPLSSPLRVCIVFTETRKTMASIT